GDLYARLTEPPDVSTARHWYELAAQAGHRRAATNLRLLDEDSSGGWGAEPPNDDEIDAMAHWRDGPGTSVDAAMEVVAPGMDAITDAMRTRDTSALKAASAHIARTLADRLPTALPTPDPDLNRALQALIDDGDELNAAIQAIADAPTPEQMHTVQSRVMDLVSTAGTLMWTYERDGEIIDGR
ncbi:MAG TPA: hypothetical protein VJ777_06905, partial [Mycobacterium sp.]|nr:hypothetical protein [Mycobacterium sp.]